MCQISLRLINGEADGITADTATGCGYGDLVVAGVLDIKVGDIQGGTVAAEGIGTCPAIGTGFLIIAGDGGRSIITDREGVENFVGRTRHFQLDAVDAEVGEIAVSGGVYQCSLNDAHMEFAIWILYEHWVICPCHVGGYQHSGHGPFTTGSRDYRKQR